MTMQMMDADVAIDILRGYGPADLWFSSLRELPDISGFAAMELIQGCYNARELQAVNKLLSGLNVVWPTKEDYERALQDFTSFRLSHSVGMLDTLIGATAVGSGAALLTFNEKHYRLIPNLVTTKPYTRA